MLVRFTLSTVLVPVLAISCPGQDEPKPKPVELEVLKASIGVWDARIEVWPRGLDAPSIKFKGVETNRAYGEHWIASDFDSEFMGQTTKVHSIVGYDLDKKGLVGTVVDHGPYKATMTGTYDAKTKTVVWMTQAKQPDGTPMVQKTTVTRKSANERELVLMAPGKKKGVFKKLMQINYVKRKQDR